MFESWKFVYKQTHSAAESNPYTIHHQSTLPPITVRIKTDTLTITFCYIVRIISLAEYEDRICFPLIPFLSNAFILSSGTTNPSSEL